jgi:hypothetical protein
MMANFVWVDFLPQFHTSLIKHMVTLLPPGVTVSQGKKVLFVFLLEILTGDESIKPKVFWRTCKKHSRASQATRKAKRATKVSNPLPLPSAPAPAPPIPDKEPHTIVAPSGINTEQSIAWLHDMLMQPKTPSQLKATSDPFFPASNQDFTHSFLRQVGNTTPIQA